MLYAILAFFILLSVVVFVHEYGHYYFAKKYGVKVEVFSIGFGKEIFGWNDKYGTRWKFSWIPLGGYVKFFGDHNIFSDFNKEELRKKYNEQEQNKLLAFKTLGQKTMILLGGPLANFFLALVIFIFLNIFVGKDFTPAIINEVQKDSPAMIAGLKKNDIIISIDDRKVKSIMEVSKFITISTDEFVNFTVSRSNQNLTFKVKPNIVSTKDNLGNKMDKRMIGIQLSPYNNEINHVKLSPTKAIYYAFNEIYFVCSFQLKYIWGLIQKLWGQGSGDASQLGGPIGIAFISGKVFQMGLLPFINIIAYISISLGLINLFPIPLLDGGHIALNFIERIKGSEFKKETLENTFRIGLSIIIALMVFGAYNDVNRTGFFDYLKSFIS